MRLMIATLAALLVSTGQALALPAGSPSPQSRRAAASTATAAPVPARQPVPRHGLGPDQVEKLMGHAIALTRSESPEQGWAEIQKLNVKHPSLRTRFERSLQAKLKTDPTDGDALYALGILQAVTADYAQAAKTFAQAAAVRQNDPYVQAYHGFALLEAGSPLSAAKPLHAALSLKPDFRFARMLLAQSYFRRGDRQQAAKLLMPAVERRQSAPPS